MSQIYATSASFQYKHSGGSVKNESHVITSIQDQMTNVDTKSDAWGKVIPLSFGKVRVGGQLIWASQFYKTLTSFDDTTTITNISSVETVTSAPTSDQLETGQYPQPGSTFEDTSTSSSQVAHGVITDSFIDLCYSVGKEGDPRKKRYIDKIRINETVVYDDATQYVAPGLGMKFRYGYDENPPPLLAKYANGKFHYPGQTLIVFDRFPLANWGNAIPQNLDVEFGCCSEAECIFDAVPITALQIGDIAIVVVCSTNGSFAAPATFTLKDSSVSNGKFAYLYVCPCTSQQVIDDLQAFTGSINGATTTSHIRCLSGGGGGSFNNGSIRQAALLYRDAGVPYNPPYTALGPSFAEISFINLNTREISSYFNFIEGSSGDIAAQATPPTNDPYYMSVSVIASPCS